MKIFTTFAFASAVLAPIAAAASSWSFEEASLTVSGKGSDGLKEKFSPSSALTKAVTLPANSNLKIVLTTTEGKTGKRAHQAFLNLHDTTTGLEESFPFTLKDNGKGKVEISQKDLPIQLLTSTAPLTANVIIGSFGTSKPYFSHVFDLAIETDSTAPATDSAAPERYVSKPEIHHIFKADPRSPPTVLSLVFTLAVLATLPVLIGGWALIGGNLNHVGKALGASPVAHVLFFGSVVAMEGVFFLYYASWNLFQTLPVAAVVAVVAYVSGSRALTEVQERRLAGER